MLDQDADIRPARAFTRHSKRPLLPPHNEARHAAVVMIYFMVFVLVARKCVIMISECDPTFIAFSQRRKNYFLHTQSVVIFVWNDSEN
jgi:hypothetical protein